MTLGDFLRKYLEERRRICEEKARFLDLGRDVVYFSKEGENANYSESSNGKYFSNTLEKKPKLKDDTCVKCNKIQTSKTIRVTRRPDGKIETETTLRDGNGNEEKTVTYQDGDKVYTTVTRTDASGNKEVRHRIGQKTGNNEIAESLMVPLPEPPSKSQNSDDDYDFWFNKFFGNVKPTSETDKTTKENGKKDETMQDSGISDNLMKEFDAKEGMPFDFNNVEDNINKLLQMFENDLPGTFKNQWTPNDSDTKDWFVEDVMPQISDEASKFIEGFENDTQKFTSKNKKAFSKKKEKDVQAQVDNIMKNFLSPKMPSLFEQFAERAIVEVPEEKTPLDKFIDDDDETKKKRLSILRESSEYMKKLNSYFDRKLSLDGNSDVYSDIDPANDDDFALFVPQPNPTPNLNDFSKILAKQFGPFSGINFNITTSSKMRFPNGNLRTETVKKNEHGNYEKSITYEAGNKVFTLITVTSPSGQRIQRQRKLNFSENELSNFKKQWDARYQSDFSD